MGSGNLNIFVAVSAKWLLLALIAAASAPFWTPAQAYGQGYWNLASHSQGNIQLNVNPGGWGYTPWSGEQGWVPHLDVITGDSVYGCEYPRESRNMYLCGELTLAAVAGRDTLCSAPWGFDPFRESETPWQVRSSNPASTYYSPEARSDLDLECPIEDTIAHDTLSWTTWERGPHVPLEVIGTQRSMAWSGSLVDDFVLLEYELINVGNRPLKGAWVAFWCDSYGLAHGMDHETDDLTGFLKDYAADNCGSRDILNVAYCMDNEGDPVNGQFFWNSRKGAVGVMLLGSSADSVELGYNWYIWDPAGTEDWGPRRESTPEEPFRSFNPYFAHPGSARNLYYVLSHPHIAYDQLFSAVDHFGWLPPGRLAETAATGWPFDMLYYFGRFRSAPKRRSISRLPSSAGITYTLTRMHILSRPSHNSTTTSLISQN